MKKENRNMKKNRQILVLAALLFSFLCFPADKVLAASNVVEVPLTVKQNFEEILYLIFDYPHKHYTFKYFEV